jgi:plastocyanin
MRTLACLAILAMCGCGGDDNGTTTSVPATTATIGPVPSTVTVQVGPGGTKSFSPATVNIKTGDSVEWIWDSGPHTVTSIANGSPDGTFCSRAEGQHISRANCNSTSYAQGAGTTFSWTFLVPGTFPYISTVDGPAMSGTVIVTE